MADRFSMPRQEVLPIPWKETCVMDERMRFVVAAREEGGGDVAGLRGVRHQPRHRVPVAGALRRGRDRGS